MHAVDRTIGGHLCFRVMFFWFFWFLAFGGVHKCSVRVVGHVVAALMARLCSEELYEDEDFPSRELAAAVASKVRHS